MHEWSDTQQENQTRRTRVKNLNSHPKTMLNRCQKKLLSVMIFSLCITVTAIQGQQKMPTEISLLVIPATTGQCASDDNKQDSLDFVRDVTYEIIYGSLHPECGPGEWRRVFYLNTSKSDQSCPGQWNLVARPVRGCAGVHFSCRSAFSDNIKITYTKACGSIIGVGIRTLDGFKRYISTQTTIEGIEGNYLDGVSITHGASGSRTHIWTLGASNGERCPCDNSDRDFAPLPPAEVGDNYFCDRADGLDPLWTGESCTTNNPCCSFHNPPYFSVQLPAATTDKIELRICTDQSESDETVLVSFAEIYVQ